MASQDTDAEDADAAREERRVKRLGELLKKHLKIEVENGTYGDRNYRRVVLKFAGEEICGDTIDIREDKHGGYY